MSKRYLIRRLLLVVPVLLGTILLVFALVFLTPGDPIARLAGNKPLAPSTYAEITARYHLDQPFVVQYLYYIDGLVHGDLGATFTGRDVTDIIKERLPVTLKLTAGSFAVEVVLGLLLALVAAVKRRTFIDSSILVFTLLMITVPVIVLGFMLQWLFGVKLHWLPVAGVRDGPASYVLPSLTLGLGLAASLGRLARSNVLDNMGGEHIRAAIARRLTPAPRRRQTRAEELAGADRDDPRSGLRLPDGRRGHHRDDLQPARARLLARPGIKTPERTARRRARDAVGDHLRLHEPVRGPAVRSDRSEDQL